MKKTYFLTGLAFLWTLMLFLVFLQIDLGGEVPEGWEDVGTDVRIYMVAANHLAKGESPYPQAEEALKVGTYPYDLTFAALTVPLTQVDPGVAAAVFQTLSFLSLLLLTFLSIRLIKGEGYQPPWWGWALLLVNTAVIGTLSYGNVDATIIAVGLGLLLSLRRKNWLVAGILIAVLFATKFFWLALLAYAIARRDWPTLIKSLLVAAAVHVITNGLVILSLGWDKGITFYLHRYAFLSQVSNTQVLPNYWGSNSLQQTFYNLFGDGGTLPAILAAVVLVGLFLFLTFQMVMQTRSKHSAMTYALIAWVVSLMLQPRLEYAGLLATIFIYCWAATQTRSVRLWNLGALPYVLAQFPTLIGQFMGIDLLNWAVSPAIIFGLLTSLIALILLLNEQKSEPTTAETSV